MAYYNMNQTPPQPQQPQGAIPQVNQQGMQMMGQNVQPLFPQPTGNVYNINSTLEVANVPVGAGMSVAICWPENTMYIKTMQNGNPLFYPYKIEPFTNEVQQDNKQQSQEMMGLISALSDKLNTYISKVDSLESKVSQESNKKSGGFDI